MVPAPLPRLNRVSGGVGEWLKPADCKSVAYGYAGSNPAPSTSLNILRADGQVTFYPLSCTIMKY